MCTRQRRGTTLVELMVVLVILGVMLGVVGIGLAGLRRPGPALRLLQLQQARRQALVLGVPVMAAEMNALPGVRFLPDGQGVGAGVDPLNGEPVDADQR